MLYAEKTLLPGEKILYYTKPHYIIFYRAVLWVVFAALILISNYIGTFIGKLLLLTSIFSCINVFIDYYCSEFVITNKRVLIKLGFIRRQSLEIFLERIEGIYVDQGIVGRMLNFGTLIVGGIGGTKNPFFYIPDPIKFRSNVQQQIQAISKG
ncbi:MAG: putative membrane-associated protein [uncultured bacterium]|nr:MAG: putative membrane-associated protein [uncultured bacterium]